jgi:hypothetical protein
MALVREGRGRLVTRSEDATCSAPRNPSPTDSPELAPEEWAAWNEMIEHSGALSACWVLRAAAIAERQLERWRARGHRDPSAGIDPGRHESDNPDFGLIGDRLKTRRLPR